MKKQIDLKELKNWYVCAQNVGKYSESKKMQSIDISEIESLEIHGIDEDYLKEQLSKIILFGDSILATNMWDYLYDLSLAKSDMPDIV